MTDKRDSEFISNYDAFAPPLEDTPVASEGGGGAGKLLIFLLMLPSWIVAFLFGLVVYSQVSHKAVNLGPVQIAASLSGSPASASGGGSSEDLQKISQRLDELSAKLDAVAASRSTAPGAEIGAVAPGAGAPSASPGGPSAPGGVGAIPTSPAMERSARGKGSKAVASAGAETAPPGAPKANARARQELSSAISRGKELIEDITDFARQHGGSLGAQRSRFVRQSDEWLNSTYNMVQEKVGGSAALSFMGAEPSDTDVEGVSGDDSRMVRSLQARIAALEKMGGESSAKGSSDSDM